MASWCCMRATARSRGTVVGGRERDGEEGEDEDEPAAAFATSPPTQASSCLAAASSPDASRTSLFVPGRVLKYPDQ